MPQGATWIRNAAASVDPDGQQIELGSGGNLMLKGRA
jgi:hypothetical protein